MTDEELDAIEAEYRDPLERFDTPRGRADARQDVLTLVAEVRRLREYIQTVNHVLAQRSPDDVHRLASAGEES